MIPSTLPRPEISAGNEPAKSTYISYPPFFPSQKSPSYYADNLKTPPLYSGKPPVTAPTEDIENIFNQVVGQPTQLNFDE